MITINKVSRIYPEAKTGLINWIEENFHDIDSFVSTFTLKDGTSMTVYHCNSFIEAMGIIGVTQTTISTLSNEELFVPKNNKE